MEKVKTCSLGVISQLVRMFSKVACCKVVRLSLSVGKSKVNLHTERFISLIMTPELSVSLFNGIDVL